LIYLVNRAEAASVCCKGKSYNGQIKSNSGGTLGDGRNVEFEGGYTPVAAFELSKCTDIDSSNNDSESNCHVNKGHYSPNFPCASATVVCPGAAD
jgi:hypothetical protein